MYGRERRRQLVSLGRLVALLATGEDGGVGGDVRQIASLYLGTGALAENQMTHLVLALSDVLWNRQTYRGLVGVDDGTGLL